MIFVKNGTFYSYKIPLEPSNLVTTCWTWSTCSSGVRENMKPYQIRQDQIATPLLSKVGYWSLKRPWWILQSKQHAGKTEEASVRSRGRFITILLDNLELKIFNISVQCRTLLLRRRAARYIHLYLMSGTDPKPLLHSTWGSRATEKSLVLLRDKNNRQDPSRSGRLNIVHGEHSI